MANVEARSGRAGLGQSDRLAFQRGAIGTVWLVQLGGLLALSAVAYRGFALGEDFGIYYQAWWLLGHGHLDPGSSLLGTRFVASNAELMLWPLSVLGRLWGSPFLLLVLQDLALVATNALTLSWVTEALRRERQLSASERRNVEFAVLVGLLADPWCYQSARYDFHFEVVIGLFAILVGRALWKGRTAMMVPLAALLLLSGSSGALAAVGAGLGGLLTGHRLRWSGGLFLAGVADALVLSRLGLVGAHGALFDDQYRYLTTVRHGSVGAPAVLAGIVRHPLVPLRELASKVPLVLELTVPVGLVGLASPWGFGMAAAILLPALLASHNFLNPFAAFQAWPALPFVTFGSALLLARLLESNLPVRVRTLLARAALGLLGSATAALLFAWASTTAAILGAQAGAGRGAGAVLRTVTPETEVVAWASAVGRFSGRRWSYAFNSPSATFPIQAKTVVFLLPGPAVYGAGATGRLATGIARDATELGATPIPDASPWVAFVWHPGPGVTAVRLEGFRPVHGR